MADTFSNDLRLRLQESGSNAGTWGDLLNGTITNIASGFGQGSEAIPNASTHTITLADGTADEARSLYLKCTGGGQACTVTLGPNTISKVWIIDNATAYTLTFSQGSGANVAIAAGAVKVIATDGAGSGAAVVDTLDGLEGSLSTLAVSGTATMGGLTVNPTASAEISGAVSGNYILKLDNTHATSGNGLRIETPSTSSGEFGLVVKSNNGSNNNLVVSNAGNVGIGVVPETWQSTIDALQIGLGGSFAGNTVNPSRVYLSANYYINSSNQESYIATDEASQYFQNAGTHTFKVAPSGTADSAISWITAATIDNSGSLLVGRTSVGTSGAGHSIRGDSSAIFSRTGGEAISANSDADGAVIKIRRSGTTVGSINTEGGDMAIGNDDVGLQFINGGQTVRGFNMTTNSRIDAQVDLGMASTRFKDLYLSGVMAAGNGSASTPSVRGADTNTGLYFPSGGVTAFTQNGVEATRLDSSGRLLVNTSSVLSSSGAKLQVLQTVTGQWSQRINNSTGSPYGLAIDYVSASPNGTANQFHYCTDTGGARWGVYSNGGVLNYSGNNVNLSDRNAKKDITLHTDDEWNCVKAWEIVDYRYNDEADDSPAKIGVIAQQIQEHCPDLVNVFQEQADAVEEVLGEDGEVVTEAKAAVEERIGVNEAQMMWKVTKALQEAMERIETLEAKVQTLENN